MTNSQETDVRGQENGDSCQVTATHAITWEEDFISIKPGTLGEVVGKPVRYQYVLAITAEFSLKIISFKLMSSREN